MSLEVEHAFSALNLIEKRIKECMTYMIGKIISTLRKVAYYSNNNVTSTIVSSNVNSPTSSITVLYVNTSRNDSFNHNNVRNKISWTLTSAETSSFHHLSDGHAYAQPIYTNIVILKLRVTSLHFNAIWWLVFVHYFMIELKYIKVKLLILHQFFNHCKY